MSGIFAAVAAWTLAVVQGGGYVGVAALVVLENLFPPIPSELILPVAGFLTSQGQLQFVPAVVAATIGSVVGALILYELGRRLGKDRLCRFVRDHGRWLLLEESDVEQAEQWFERHGGMAVLIGRLVPSVRSFISIPAGVARMPLWQFIGYTTLGSGVFNSVLVGAGWLLGDRWEMVEPYLNVLEWAATAALVGILGRFIWKRARKLRSSQTASSARGG